MWMAAFGDVHGNLPALEAVLGAIDDAGIHTMVCTGDSVVGGKWPNEVIDRLRTRAVPLVQGESDRRAVRFLRKHRQFRERLTEEEFDSLERTHEALSSGNIEFLGLLPRQRTMAVEGISIHVSHEGPGPALDEEGVRRAVALCRFRESANAGIVVFGATHRPFSAWLDGALFVNPGAVGVAPRRKHAAMFAIVDTECEPYRAEMREVKY